MRLGRGERRVLLILKDGVLRSRSDLASLLGLNLKASYESPRRLWFRGLVLRDEKLFPGLGESFVGGGICR